MPALHDPVRPTEFRRVFCLGKNYTDHAVEFASFAQEADVIPEYPIVFSKPAGALCAATDDIEVSARFADALDYEAELGVVVGTAGFEIPAHEVLEHVAGYTIVNDLTARDLQTRHGQWFLGKSLHRATPVGPRIVPRAEFDGLERRVIRCRVNGELRQEAVLGQMIVGVEAALSLLSAVVPLEPGDLIAMGTPSGVGAGFSPPRYLADGDRVVCEIEGIGELDNTIRVRQRTADGRASAAVSPTGAAGGQTR
jgi:2-keto-4-pentenoate hydratase/2-oxohepta-3-ene-1,7-dioic acid hydratase in catechol pathway